MNVYLVPAPQSMVFGPVEMPTLGKQPGFRPPVTFIYTSGSQDGHTKMPLLVGSNHCAVAVLPIANYPSCLGSLDSNGPWDQIDGSPGTNVSVDIWTGPHMKDLVAWTKCVQG